MDEGENENVVNIHQDEIDLVGLKACDFAYELMLEHDKFTANEILNAIYAGCCKAAEDLNIYVYRKFLEDVEYWQQYHLPNIREGFAMFENGLSEQERIEYDQSVEQRLKYPTAYPDEKPDD